MASEYTRGALIVHACQPTGRILPGWGEPDSDYAGVRFRTAILSTVTVLDKAIPPSCFPRQERDKSSQFPSRSVRESLLAKYIPLTQGENPVLPKSLMPLLLLYERHLEHARWNAQEPTKAQYEDCLRIVAVLLDVLGKRLPLNKERTNDFDSTFING